MLFGIGAMMNFEIHQMDVKTTFLHGELKESVYIIEPKGYEEPNFKELVYKLQITIYGLK
jgi:hypothetical protein